MKKILTAATAYSISTLKDFRLVSLSLTYTRKGSPSQTATKHISVDVDTLMKKASQSKVFLAMKEKITTMKSKKSKEEYEIMAEYQWKVIWLDEMGNEKESYHETDAERNSKLQALVDDGYSPVWREA